MCESTLKNLLQDEEKNKKKGAAKQVLEDVQRAAKRARRLGPAGKKIIKEVSS